MHPAAEPRDSDDPRLKRYAQRQPQSEFRGCAAAPVQPHRTERPALNDRRHEGGHEHRRQQGKADGVEAYPPQLRIEPGIDDLRQSRPQARRQGPREEGQTRPQQQSTHKEEQQRIKHRPPERLNTRSALPHPRRTCLRLFHALSASGCVDWHASCLTRGWRRNAAPITHPVAVSFLPVSRRYSKGRPQEERAEPCCRNYSELLSSSSASSARLLAAARSSARTATTVPPARSTAGRANAPTSPFPAPTLPAPPIPAWDRPHRTPRKTHSIPLTCPSVHPARTLSIHSLGRADEREGKEAAR